MATTSIRWTLVEHLVDLFAQHPQAGPVKVLSFPPGDLDVTDELLFWSGGPSTVEIPTIRSGRHARDEFLTLTWTIGVNGRESPAATMTRWQEIASIVEDTFADDASLDSLDGVISAEVTATDVEPARSPDGFFVLGTVTTEIHTRLS